MWKRLLTNSWDLGFGGQLFLCLRWVLTPYSKVARHIPVSGAVLDVGCGHGLLSLYLAEHHPNRQVIGVDHDNCRIQAATRAKGCLVNIEFIKESAEYLPDGTLSAVILMDVLHYFPAEVQVTILKNARARIAEGGVVLVREVDATWGIGFALSYLYEWISTRVRFTKTEKSQLFFRTPAQWTELLESQGLTVTSEIVSGCLFSDILFIGKA